MVGSIPIPIGWAPFLEPSVPAFCIASALVLLTAWRLSGRAHSLRDRILGLGVWTAALVVGYAQLLSLVRALHWPAALALSAGGALVAWLSQPGARRVVFREGGRAFPALTPGERGWLFAFAVPTAAYLAWSVWLIAVSTEPLGDNLTYHLPRLAYWMQHQTLAPFPSNDPRIGSFPVDGNALQLWPVLFLKHECLCAFVQLACHLGAGLAVYAAARELGGPRSTAAGASFVWLSIPAALRQATTSNVDVVASFMAVATAAFALACLRRGSAWLAWTCFVVCCLSVGTKPQTLPIALAGAGVAASTLWRLQRGRAFRWAPVALAFALLTAGRYPLQNLQSFGSLSGLASVQWVVLNPGFRTLSKNVQLVLLPLSLGKGLDWSFPSWTLRAALFERGLGAPWLLLVGAALLLVTTRATLAPRSGRLRLAYAGTGVFFAATVLFTLRHQPSIDRFLLPAAAVLTPLVGAILVGRGRAVRLAIVWVAGSLSLLCAAQGEVALRSAGNGPRLHTSYVAVGGGPNATLARAAERIASGGRGRRIGVLVPQVMLQRMLLGARFENVLVPLDLGSPVDPRAAQQLGLDAVVMGPAADYRLQLFRRTFTPPVSPPADDWRLTAPDSFDADFVRAHESAVEYPSFEQSALLFGHRGSGWTLDPTVRSGNLFFVRGGRKRPALSIFYVVSPGGAEEVGGYPFYWLGPGDAYFGVFAGGPGRAVLRAQIRRGIHLQGDKAHVELRCRDGAPVRALAVAGSVLAIPFDLAVGLSAVALRVVDEPGPGTRPTARVEQLGALDLRITWDRAGADQAGVELDR